jgi:sigma-B regulation protein RsbU (phosphoserine phosphatase)
MPEDRLRPLGPLRDRRRGVGHTLLHTAPGLAIVIGFAVRVAVAVAFAFLGSAPLFLRVVNSVAGIALAGGAAYFVYQFSLVARRRLLWRVRRKLILSYIFIGVVPALLIVAFFLLSGVLVFYNFSSYLVQSHLRGIGDRAKFLAESTALEIQSAGSGDVAAIAARRQASIAAEFPGLSIAALPAGRPCGDTGTSGVAGRLSGHAVIAGPWRHVAPPDSVPAWIDCKGFSGLIVYSAVRAGDSSSDGADVRHLLIRSAAFSGPEASSTLVVVDLPVDDAVRQELRRETGVGILDVNAVVENARGLAALPGRGDDRTAERSSSGSGILGNLPSLLEYRDWTTGATGLLTVSTELRVAELYDRISSAQGLVGRKFGEGLLLALFIIGGLFLIIEAVALVTGLALARSITGSVHALFTGTERVRQGDFSHRIAVRSQDQLGELSVSFNDMTGSIKGLLREAEEKKRLEEELRIAREIQMSLLPQGPLVMPGLSVTALCVPAREVGGDYYDFFRLGDRRLGILIADVAGKGTSAALYMAELKGLVLSLTRIHSSPRELMLAADRIIAANLDARSFITMTYAVVDLDARTMTYARAGHTPLMYLPGQAGTEDRRVRVLTPDGLVLGLNIDQGETFARLLEERTIALGDGDLALFFTDGITEAMNESDEYFGEGRLGQIVESHSHLSSDDLRALLLREIESFVGGAPQHDDMTMILLKIEESVARPAVDAAAAGAHV